MLGGFRTDLLVTVTLIFLTRSGTHCRAENDMSSIKLPNWRRDSEYVTQCSFSKSADTVCNWASTHNGSDTTTLDTIESDALDQGQACLEFWYLAPPNALKLRALLKSTTGTVVEIWMAPDLSRDSWRQVFVPLNIIESGTKVVLEAVRAVSLETQVTFNSIGVRSGSCGPQCEPNQEIWTDRSTRCVCSDRRLYCAPSPCPKGQSCNPQIRSPREVSNTGMCTIHSNTDCSTFDRVLFRFMAPCNYILAKTCSSSEALSTFSVEVLNEQDGNSSLPAVRQVIVTVGNDRVSLLKRQTRRVVVNGIWRNLPLSFRSKTIKIKSNQAAVVLETRFGLSVSYDNAGDVHISLPSVYSEKVCGLCGNFNHLQEDDLRNPDGAPARDATDLANSWQSRQTNSTCDTSLVPHQCDPVEETEYGNELNCGALLSSTGPFAACRSFLRAESYFRGCLNKMCSAHGDPSVLCETLGKYADTCGDAGVAVPAWWNSTICPPQCGENSHYNSCARGCPDVCSIQDILGSCGRCEERCECDEGFKLSGGKCVPVEECGCWHEGKHYERGQTILEGECLQLCRCMGGNNIQCTKMQCARSEVCKVEDGVKGCFPIEPATCSVYGDPHYVTFDGMAYDFEGGCSYTLATTCGAGSSVHFTVTGHNMHPPLHNFTRSKLDAVTLQIEDLHLTLNQSAKVYVNATYVELPYSITASYGSVWVYENNSYVVLETSFGLRMVVDGKNRFFLQVDESYKYQLCGLCGTYSEQQDDDFIKPSGQNATDPFEFADSWRAPHRNECVSHPNDPQRCETAEEENEAYAECFAIFGAPFKPCHETIHPSVYINSCVHDYCATSGNQHTLCESLQSYTVACRVAGVTLPDWPTGSPCAESQTTENPPITSPSPTLPSQTPEPVSCPLNCDFEKNLCGWQQLIQDTFDWTRYSGATPTIGSGPNHDHTTGGGFYMYIEGDSVTQGDPARLLSSECHYSGPVCLQFWYHMYGSATAMTLNMYLLQGNIATKIWSIKNNRGQEWHLGQVDIDVFNPFQIIVEGIRGSDALSDVAIDDISIQFHSCSSSLGGGTGPPLTTEVFPSDPVCSLNCSFDRDFCAWKQMITDAFDWTWQSGSTPTLMTGPSSDHTGDGHYLYIEASTVSHGDTARLISSECTASGPQCLHFWYHMYGSADTMGLHLYLLQDKKADAIWWKRNDQGNMWHLAQVDLTVAGAFQIIIEGRRGSNKESDVAIDDVTLYHGQCSDRFPVPSWPPVANATQHPVIEATTNLIIDGIVRGAAQSGPPQSECQLNCNFDQDLCQWEQLVTDAFDWARHRGSTPTLMTGPSSDHTTEYGHYLYIEADNASHGDTARLISSQCSASGPQCLQFWYHMSGSADTMGLHLYLLRDKKADPIWWKRNDQGNMWHLAEVDLTVKGAFQIIIEGRRGSNERSDVAIDDVTLYNGHCSELSGVVTTHNPKPEGNHTIPPSITTPVTAVTELPAVNVTDQRPATARPPGANATVAAVTEATTNGIMSDNVPEDAQNRRPPHSVCQLGCNFEKDLCQWKQLVADVFDWTRQSGSTHTLMTGPSSDHTTGHGHYLYTEANGPSLGDTARLISAECSATGPQCLHFWYHMYGSAETMGLHVYLLQDKKAQAISWTRNNQGNMWRLAQVDFTATGSFQIIFEGRRGSNEQSDVAIDDISLYSGRCSDLAEPTTPASMTTPSVTTEGLEPTAGNVSTTQPPTSTVKTTTHTTDYETQTITPTTTPNSNVNVSIETPAATTTIEPRTTVTARPSSTNHPVDEGTEDPGPEPTTEEVTAPMTYPHTTTRPTPLTTESFDPTTGSHPETPNKTPPVTVDEGTEDPGPEPTTEEVTPPMTYPHTTTRPIPLTTEIFVPTTGSHPETPPGTPEPPSTTSPEPQPPNATTEPQSTMTHKPQHPNASQPATTGRPQPPTTPESTPPCRQNSHYSACIPACGPTCRFLNGPPHCNDSAVCEPGCVCDDGYVLKLGVCVPIRQCGCVDRDGNKYALGQVWYTKHCRHKCRCEKEEDAAAIECDEEECDGNDVCLQNEEGHYYCRKTGFDECRINGDPAYRTFDNMKHDFEGEHSYVLVRTRNLPSNVQDVYIEGINTPDGDDNDDDDDGDQSSEEDSDEDESNDHEEHHGLQSLKIKVYNHTVEFKKLQKLFVDGRRTKTPVSPSLGLNIRKHLSHIYLTTDFGLSVKFDGHSDAEITLPRTYKRKVGGLCGNFDGRILNDRMKPDGTVAKSVQEFGESWRV
ncbi:zonadhesin-like isoform X2 [Hippocampus zosterae]|uniref:zonadhesin-like isoform X2 n=1 Tax=Hippocampus zosterae TaxID=109293 RepID=UPI00223CDAF8|nr:zonadhesin-like isoform X2 [Hippocampus zosterae]